MHYEVCRITWEILPKMFNLNLFQLLALTSSLEEIQGIKNQVEH